MPFDYSKLRGRIREICHTQDCFRKKMGMARSTLSLRLNGKAPWTQDEMVLALEVLEEPISKVKVYFFSE